MSDTNEINIDTDPQWQNKKCDDINADTKGKLGSLSALINVINRNIAHLVPPFLKSTFCESLLYIMYWILLIFLSITISYFLLVGSGLFVIFITTINEYD